MMRVCAPAVSRCQSTADWASRASLIIVSHSSGSRFGDESPGWERAELAQEVGMINSVERPRQIRVQDPPPPGSCERITHIRDTNIGAQATARPRANISESLGRQGAGSAHVRRAAGVSAVDVAGIEKPRASIATAIRPA
jgi:hypothetical protein